MGWLDALRGFAAVVVALHHFMPHLLPGVKELFRGWLATGRYGVLLFFLVSGYVIPMSLERYGSLRRFWIGRIFRIYPAWLLAVVLACLAIAVLGHRRMPPELAADPVTGALAHLTMTQELLGLPNLIGALWTLSYEMVFYLLMSALFVWGLHRRVAWAAVGLAGAALAGGRLLPDGLLVSRGPGLVVTAVVVGALVVGSVVAYVSGRRTAALVAGSAGFVVVALPALNGAATSYSHTAGSWQSLTLLAVMFSGAVIHAGQHGRLRRRTAVVVLATVGACLLATAWLHTPRPGQPGEVVDRVRGAAVGTLVAVAVTFAVGYALRHRAVPRWCAWLGRISYSVYLLHQVVLWVLATGLAEARQLPLAVRLLIAAGYLGIVLVVSHAAYRWVEQPGQAWGRRVARAVAVRRDERPEAMQRRARQVPT
jgi:peptidoglycan/LPS O-acetylase OafA/YrhL